MDHIVGWVVRVQMGWVLWSGQVWVRDRLIHSIHRYPQVDPLKFQLMYANIAICIMISHIPIIIRLVFSSLLYLSLWCTFFFKPSMQPITTNLNVDDILHIWVTSESILPVPWALAHLLHHPRIQHRTLHQKIFAAALMKWLSSPVHQLYWCHLWKPEGSASKTLWMQKCGIRMTMKS